MAKSSSPSVVDALERVPLLAGLSKRSRQRLGKAMTERTYPPGKQVVTEGQGGVGFFIILEGRASVTVHGDVVKVLGAGDSFGELALLDGQPRAATVTATTELSCVTVTLSGFRSFVLDNPPVAWAMLQSLAGIARQNALR